MLAWLSMGHLMHCSFLVSSHGGGGGAKSFCMISFIKALIPFIKCPTPPGHHNRGLSRAVISGNNSVIDYSYPGIRHMIFLNRLGPHVCESCRLRIGRRKSYDLLVVVEEPTTMDQA